jgi:SWI/SNF-related matrix-associated actin-dependent regulator of chromatin subfamily B member 1
MPSSQPISSTINGNNTISGEHLNGIETINGKSNDHTSTSISNGIGTSAKETPQSVMEQNKQKAKAIMASSGLSKDTSATPPSNNDNALNQKSPDGQANGIQSRKRSRSGSRLPKASNQGEANPPRNDPAMLERIVNKEQLYAMSVIENERVNNAILTDLKAQTKRFDDESSYRVRYPGIYFGIGYAGYGNGFQDVNHLGDYPLDRPKMISIDKHRRPGNRQTRPLRISRKDMATQAEQIDELVPIRLDIEWDKIRLRDTFTWNLHDRVVNIELFAHQLVEDMNLDPSQCGTLVHEIVRNIQEQISEYHPHVFIPEEPLDPTLPYFAYKNDEMRIIIKLNITIGANTLVDQFEWDINNVTNQPEEFAALMTRDLGLTGEFTTAIAHSIREQCQLFTRSLFVIGHPFDGRPIEDHELQASFQPSPIPSIFRPHQAAKEFTPYMYELNDQELEKTELSLSREERRQKRSVNRRGGPALPDLKDRRRTIRTLLVSSVLPGAVRSQEESRLFKRATISNKGRRGLARLDGDDSDDSESDDSSTGSLANHSHQFSGTGRTRPMRGAGLVSQAVTRATLGRSATPDPAYHHEPRPSARRIIRDDSSPEPQQSLIVKLKLGRARLQQILRAERARSKEALSATPGRPTSRQSSTAPTGPGSMGPPTSTPRMQSQGLPHQSNGTPNGHSATSKQAGDSRKGRVDALGPPTDPAYPVVSLYNRYISLISDMC